MKYRTRIYYSADQRAEIWDHWQLGESMSSIGSIHAINKPCPRTNQFRSPGPAWRPKFWLFRIEDPHDECGDRDSPTSDISHHQSKGRL
jgi:hypothetical protein